MDKTNKNSHPHASLMMEYAKDCRDDADAWKHWECYDNAIDMWITLDRQPLWDVGKQYRKKQIVKRVNGIVVPIHLTIVPEREDLYFYVDADGSVNSRPWLYSKYDFAVYEFNNCYATEEDALANRDAMKSNLFMLE